MMNAQEWVDADVEPQDFPAYQECLREPPRVDDVAARPTVRRPAFLVFPVGR